MNGLFTKNGLRTCIMLKCHWDRNTSKNCGSKWHTLAITEMSMSAMNIIYYEFENILQGQNTSV